MENQASQKSRSMLGVATLAVMNLAVICTLRGLPIMAEEGLSLIFYFVVAILLFLIPVSLVCAELATGWPPHGPGGVYIWVGEAYGPNAGFLAIWLQWIQNVIWFPTVLSFVGATLAYMYNPELARNKYYMISLILAVYWGGTLLNFRGMKTSGMLSMICVVIGTIFPGLVIIGLGVAWFIMGDPVAIQFTWGNLFPDMSDIHNIVFLAGAVLIFSGMEVSATHSQEVRDPKRTFPRAIFLSASISFVILMLGSLAIAMVVPQKDLSLVAGVMETFEAFFSQHNMTWLIPIFAFLIAMGAIGEISAWIIGPAKGLLISAKNGDLPDFLKKTNKKNVPVNILITQGLIVTALTTVFLLMPTVSSSYWILSAFSVVLYLLMYVLVFAASIKLRYKQPHVVRAYKIPFGKLGMWLVAGVGILGALFTIVVGFLPPSQIDTGSIVFYETFLIGGTIILCLTPSIIRRFRKLAGSIR